MNIGYARVSTKDQNLDSQIEILNQHNCEEIYKEKVSGKDTVRPQLLKLMDMLRAGDTVTVTKLDRLARSLKDLISLVDQIHSKKANFVSVTDKIDTSSPSGKFFFHVFGAIAEFERDMIRERTLVGLNSARAKGNVGGRPKGLPPEDLGKALLVKEKSDAGVPMTHIAKMLKVSRSTAYRYYNYAMSHEDHKI